MSNVTKTVKPSRERLRDNERLVLYIGMGLAAFFSFGLIMVMVGLRYSDSIPDHSPSSTDAAVIEPDYPRHLIDFSLIDQSGNTVTRKDLKGKIVVVNFIFTSCSLVCPYVNSQMAKIQQRTVGHPEVRLISLTLDPLDDTVPVLARYGQKFEPDVRRWSFLTGDQSMMLNLIGTSFLSRDTTGQFAYMPGNFANTQRIALVDANGRIVGYFDGLSEQAADAVVNAIWNLKKASG